jgi:glutamate racemase
MNNDAEAFSAPRPSGNGAHSDAPGAQPATLAPAAQPATSTAVATAIAAPVVGVFDSGIGGFTVASQILKLRPDLNLVYFGDSLNMPYGGRSPEQIARFAHNSIEFLLEQGMEILAVGCNASNSVLGQGELKSFGVPVYDLVSSTTEWLRGLAIPPERLGLVATQATVNSGYWQRKLSEALPQAEVISVAAPRFVPLIEAPQLDEYAIRAAVVQYLAPLADSAISTIVHGCTHYPLLETYMAELFPGLAYIDPARCLAARLAAHLPPAEPQSAPGKLSLYSSLPSESFYRTGERVFNRAIRPLTKMYIVNPYED